MLQPLAVGPFEADKTWVDPERVAAAEAAPSASGTARHARVGVAPPDDDAGGGANAGKGTGEINRIAS